MRYFDVRNFDIKEEFVGLYNCPDSKAETLFTVIQDVCLRLNLEMEKLRGQCFDGAANMSGKISGVQQRLCNKYPKSMFVHCSNHALDLCLQEIARKCEIINDALTTVKDVSNIILESSKRKSIYKNIVLPASENDNDLADIRVRSLLPLCPTRWAVRVKAIERFTINIKRVQLTIKELLDTPGGIRNNVCFKYCKNHICTMRRISQRTTKH